MISTIAGYGSDTDIIFQKQDRIVKIHYPIISAVYIETKLGFCKSGIEALVRGLDDFPEDSNLLHRAVSAYFQSCHIKPNSGNIKRVKKRTG